MASWPHGHLRPYLATIVRGPDQLDTDQSANCRITFCGLSGRVVWFHLIKLILNLLNLATVQLPTLLGLCDVVIAANCRH